MKNVDQGASESTQAAVSEVTSFAVILCCSLERPRSVRTDRGAKDWPCGPPFVAPRRARTVSCFWDDVVGVFHPTGKLEACGLGIVKPQLQSILAGVSKTLFEHRSHHREFALVVAAQCLTIDPVKFLQLCLGEPFLFEERPTF